MTVMDVEPATSPIRTAHEWLREVCTELAWDHDPQRAYRALASVLHALRDTLPAPAAARLATHLPLVVRTFFDESARPTQKPLRAGGVESFLKPVVEAFSRARLQVPPLEIARAVFAVLKRHLPQDVVGEIENALPKSVGDALA